MSMLKFLLLQPGQASFALAAGTVLQILVQGQYFSFDIVPCIDA
jgi:hypothetical protein